MTVKVKFPLLGNKTILILFAAIGCVLASSPGFACPDLGRFYRLLESDPAAARAELSVLLNECYESSEYFALVGAAHLETGDLFQALENLERALLLDPENGSAAVDYAELLFRQGQVLGALEINSQLLAREDLPEGVQKLVVGRDRLWRRYTTDTDFGLGVSFGYDDNLNSAPMGEQLTLTLSGQPVSLDISPEYRAAGGEYSSLMTGVARIREGVNLTSRVSGSIRGRFSNRSDYEMLQASSLFSLAESGVNSRWNAVAGLDHLNYGGNSIYSSATVRASYLAGRLSNCNLYATAAFQYQSFHKQRSLSGRESRVGAEGDCLLPTSFFQRIGLAISGLENRAVEGDRLGADRSGWQINLAAQKQVGRGRLMAQYVRTSLNDDEGYSPIFSDGARRKESIDSIYFRYLYPVTALGRSAQITASIYYNSQRSTIALFRTRGTSAELGINWEI
tara:strand:- start:23931 stop:25283 length:1353 start_codon:yes stop_codon:yes gene_type:complete